MGWKKETGGTRINDAILLLPGTHFLRIKGAQDFKQVTRRGYLFYFCQTLDFPHTNLWKEVLEKLTNHYILNILGSRGAASPCRQGRGSQNKQLQNFGKRWVRWVELQEF